MTRRYDSNPINKTSWIKIKPRGTRGLNNYGDFKSTSYNSAPRLYNRPNHAAAFHRRHPLAICLHDRRGWPFCAVCRHDYSTRPRPKDPEYKKFLLTNPQCSIHSCSSHLDHPCQLCNPSSIQLLGRPCRGSIILCRLGQWLYLRLCQRFQPVRRRMPRHIQQLYAGLGAPL
jgi:hypothetical protein